MNCNDFRKHQILAEEEEILPSDARLHVAECSECQTYLREQERLRMAVRKLAVSEHASGSLHESIAEVCTQGQSRVRKQQGTRRWVAIAAAIVTMVGTGAGYLWYHHARTPSPERLATEFISDHLHYLPGREQIVSSSPQQVEGWFQGRVEFPVLVPEVPGTALQDARVCDISGRKAALLHYRRDPGNGLISIFVVEEPKAFEQQKQPVTVEKSVQGLNSKLWCHRGLVYSVVAALGDVSLQQIAEAVQRQQP